MSENILGALEASEKETLDNLKKVAQDLVLEIGQLEVRKARLLGTLSDVESKAQGLLSNVAKRLGIPEGTAWVVSPEGNAKVLSK